MYNKNCKYDVPQLHYTKIKRIWSVITMPLVNAAEMLTKAKKGHYAVGQFNINNLEWTKSILQTAQENNSPVILGVSEGAGNPDSAAFNEKSG